MEDASTPSSSDLLIVAVVLLLAPEQSALAFFVHEACFFIQNDFTTECSWVKVLALLQDRFWVVDEPLVCDNTRVNVVLHELFDSSELYMLEHEVHRELTTHQAYILLIVLECDICIRVRCLL